MPGVGSIAEVPFLSTVGGYRDPSRDLLAFAEGIWLPALIVGTPLAAACTRMSESQLLGTLEEDFVRTARGKGIGRRAVIWRHALPAAGGPVVALVGVNMNLILTNLALIESVFNIPGSFRYVERALINRDADLVQALVFERSSSSWPTSSPMRSTPGWIRACARASRTERKLCRSAAFTLPGREPTARGRGGRRWRGSRRRPVQPPATPACHNKRARGTYGLT